MIKVQVKVSSMNKYERNRLKKLWINRVKTLGLTILTLIIFIIYRGLIKKW